MIVFVVKSFFFSGANSYSFRQKSHTFHFFYYFYEEIIRVVCTIFIIAIKFLEMYLGDLNLLLQKSAIWFKLSVQNGKLVIKQLMYYITNTKNLFYRRVCSPKENINQNSPFALNSDCHNFSETSIQAGS